MQTEKKKKVNLVSKTPLTCLMSHVRKNRMGTEQRRESIRMIGRLKLQRSNTQIGFQG